MISLGIGAIFTITFFKLSNEKLLSPTFKITLNFKSINENYLYMPLTDDITILLELAIKLLNIGKLSIKLILKLLNLLQ